MAKPETAAAGRKPAEKQGEEAPLVERDVRGALTVLTMQYRPYNLVGPKLMRVLLAALAAAQEAGSRAIVLRSGIRHFSAGADLDLFDARAARQPRPEKPARPAPRPSPTARAPPPFNLLPPPTPPTP